MVKFMMYLCLLYVELEGYRSASRREPSLARSCSTESRRPEDRAEPRGSTHWLGMDSASQTRRVLPRLKPGRQEDLLRRARVRWEPPPARNLRSPASARGAIRIGRFAWMRTGCEVELLVAPARTAGSAPRGAPGSRRSARRAPCQYPALRTVHRIFPACLRRRGGRPGLPSRLARVPRRSRRARSGLRGP